MNPGPTPRWESLATNRKLNEFFRWLLNVRKITEPSAKQYVSYVRRYYSFMMNDPEKLTSLTPKQRNWLTTSFRAFCDFIQLDRPDIAERIRSTITYYQLHRHTQSREALYIVKSDKVREIAIKIHRLKGEPGDLIRFLVYSGLREEEAQYVWSHDLQFEDYEGILAITLNYHRGRKRAWFTLVPRPVYERLKAIEDFALAKEEARLMSKAKLGVPLSFLRKVHFNILKSVMTGDEIDALQGRCNKVRAKHYMLYSMDDLVEKYRKAWGLEVEA